MHILVSAQMGIPADIGIAEHFRLAEHTGLALLGEILLALDPTADGTLGVFHTVQRVAAHRLSIV